MAFLWINEMSSSMECPPAKTKPALAGVAHELGIFVRIEELAEPGDFRPELSNLFRLTLQQDVSARGGAHPTQPPAENDQGKSCC